MIKNISNLGDSALYCDFGNEVNEEINSYVISYFNLVVPSGDESLSILFNPFNSLLIFLSSP